MEARVDEPRRTAAMWTMAVDAVTAEVVTAFDSAGVESIVLKGPSIASWLYDDPADRPYVDSDVLVHPDGVQVAHAALEAAGFHREFGPLSHSAMESPPSAPWRRVASVVDVHETIPGATADRRRVWAVLHDGCEEHPLGHRSVSVLGKPARLAHLALHAAHHGPGVERPIEDLRRALDRVPGEAWAAAAGVAAAIGGTSAFATGLAITAEGRRVLGGLGLEPAPAAEWLLHREGVPLAAGFERLSTAPGIRDRAGILRDELVPAPEFMRWWTPLARRSRRGLAAAYLWRWLYLARHAPAGLRAWRRARSSQPQL